MLKEFITKNKLKVIFQTVYDLRGEKIKTKVDPIWGWESYKKRDSFDVQTEKGGVMVSKVD